MDFADFKALAKALGADARDCGAGHWQIYGRVRVNYYAWSRRRTAFVNGTTRGVHYLTAKQAIELAMRPEALRLDRTPRAKSQNLRRARLVLLTRDPRCHYCRTALTEETSTIDHRIPLARGGSNLPDNLVLACVPCNRDKADAMPKER